MRDWNLALLDIFDQIIGHILAAIMSVLHLSPEGLSADAYALAMNFGQAMVGVGIGLLILFFAIDLAGSAVTFRVKDREEIIKLLLMLVLGYGIVRISTPLMFYIFYQLQTILTTLSAGIGATDIAGQFVWESAEGISFTQGMRDLLEERNWAGLVMYQTIGIWYNHLKTKVDDYKWQLSKLSVRIATRQMS